MKIRKAFQVLMRLCISSDYRFVRRLRIFDAGYYHNLSTGEQPYDEGLDPLWEYLKIKGDDYGFQNLPETEWGQVADPHPLFDTWFYLSRYFPSGLKENPFAHYLKKGWRDGLQPGPFLDPEFYRARSGWQEGDPLTHYTHYGAQEVICPGPYFDVGYYLDKNPVLAGVEKEIVKHYKLHGSGHGKSPVPIFDPEFYLAQLDNDEHARRDPLSHYLGMAGRQKNRPAEWFDPDYYLDHCGIDITSASALAHYLSAGVADKIYTDARLEQLSEKPLVSIIVPVYNPDIRFLNSCIRSVLFQSYPHWELCLADDCSTEERVRSVLKDWEKSDSRIKLTQLEKNHGISGATNAAVQLATGEYLGFLDNDDELTIDCLYHVVETLNHNKAELVYTDEDLVGDDGRCLSIFRKPAFNSELLLSHNYITHFVTVARELFDRVGGFDSQYDGAQDFDLLLKLTERARSVHHIPKVLYHWRALSTSTSINHDEKGYAHEAGKLALEASIRRRNYAAEVEDGDVTYCYRLRYSVPPVIKVSVLIWSYCYAAGDIERLVKVLAKSSYSNATFRFVTDKPDVGDWINSNRQIGDMESSIDYYPVAPGTSRAQALHQAAFSCESDVVVLLDPAVLAVESDWLEELLGPFCLDDVGAVCGRVFYDGGDGRSYTLPDLDEDSADYYQAFLHGSSRHLNGLHCLQQISFCGWEVTMIDRELYMKVGGLDWNNFPAVMSMADLSLKVADTGKRIVYTPYARIHKAGNQQIPKKTKENDPCQSEEMSRFADKWGLDVQRVNPFYNREVLKDNSIDGDRFTRWFCGQGQTVVSDA